MSTKQKIIVILGPTASGKSDLAVKLAKKYNGEIISADSRQVYRGLDIGSGKVPRDLIYRNLGLLKKTEVPYVYKGVVHHLLDVASPRRVFTVAQYQKLARRAINKILAKNKIPIICGGTGFYIDALIYNYFLPAVPPNKKLRRQLEKKTTAELFQQLQKLDRRRAKNIDKYNRRRLIRALEIILITKKPVPSLNKINKIRVNPRSNPRQSASILKIGINLSKEKLKAQINRRVNKMVNLGLINETKQLLQKYPTDLPVFNTIGYREIINYLKGKISLPEATTLIRRNTYHYAKRQMTWFKRDKNIHWIQKSTDAEKLVKEFLITGK